MLDLVFAVTAFFLALTAVLLTVYNVGERRGYRDGHEMGYFEGWREAVDETFDWFAKECSEDKETTEEITVDGDWSENGVVLDVFIRDGVTTEKTTLVLTNEEYTRFEKVFNDFRETLRQ